MPKIPECEQTKTMTASGVVYAYPCWLTSYLEAGDAANDFQATLSDTASTPAGTWEEKVPTHPVDASAYGIGGVEKGRPSYCHNGLYLTVEAVGGGAFGGSCEIVVGFHPASGNIKMS